MRECAMRKMWVCGIVGLLLLGACGVEDDDPNPSANPSESAAACEEGNLPLKSDGVLTVATDRPAFPPWFEGSPRNYSGFEGEVASEIADRLGLDIKWVVEPFNKSYAPGDKDYDFDINEVTITPERAEAVDFSDPYFEDNQGILVLKDSPAASAGSIADLKDVQLGAQVGTTSLAFINSVVKPNKEPKVFDTTNDAKSALEGAQIDAFVTDVVTTVYLRDFEIKGSEVVGQYPEPEFFGLVFEKGSALVECVNEAISEMTDDGTLEDLEKEWLTQYLEVPSFE
jgi:polar amino acid transport system substrate-binding protein